VNRDENTHFYLSICRFVVFFFLNEMAGICQNVSKNIFFFFFLNHCRDFFFNQLLLNHGFQVGEYCLSAEEPRE